MRNQLTALELKVLANEFRQLVNSRLERVYDLQGSSNGKRIVLLLNKSEVPKRFLVFLAPSAAFLSAKKPAVAEQPGSLCSYLRKHVENSRLVSVSQHNSERILELVFSSGEGSMKLVVELFSKGNILLLDGSGVILAAAEQQSWKDRTVRPGFQYSYPPASVDFASISFEQFRSIILSSEKDSAVKCMATELGLSGVYSEELCARASVDKQKKPSQLSNPELQQLFSSLKSIIAEKPNPVAVLDDKGRITDVFPFQLSATANSPTKPFQSFNEAVESISLQQLQSSATAPEQAALSRKIKEMEIAIEQQKATIAGMDAAVKENSQAAEVIYLHYQEVKQVMDDYNKFRKMLTLEQLREYFGSNRIVKSIDEKTGTVILEISEA